MNATSTPDTCRLTASFFQLRNFQRNVSVFQAIYENRFWFRADEYCVSFRMASFRVLRKDRHIGPLMGLLLYRP